ncbi:hypothetical protein GE09DRAFT_1250156 [Coniochaeta sp. 2T2.1]|nr:hypothetical protein GE09DRAFT_1250156 [Coniochaeta sp. 2T2.1]
MELNCSGIDLRQGKFCCSTQGLLLYLPTSYTLTLFPPRVSKLAIQCFVTCLLVASIPGLVDAVVAVGSVTGALDLVDAGYLDEVGRLLDVPLLLVASIPGIDASCAVGGVTGALDLVDAGYLDEIGRVLLVPLLPVASICGLVDAIRVLGDVASPLDLVDAAGVYPFVAPLLGRVRVDAAGGVGSVAGPLRGSPLGRLCVPLLVAGALLVDAVGVLLLVAGPLVDAVRGWGSVSLGGVAGDPGVEAVVVLSLPVAGALVHASVPADEAGGQVGVCP